jgi:hypothetical protein
MLTFDLSLFERKSIESSDSASNVSIILAASSFIVSISRILTVNATRNSSWLLRPCG